MLIMKETMHYDASDDKSYGRFSLLISSYVQGGTIATVTVVSFTKKEEADAVYNSTMTAGGFNALKLYV